MLVFPQGKTDLALLARQKRASLDRMESGDSERDPRSSERRRYSRGVKETRKSEKTVARTLRRIRRAGCLTQIFEAKDPELDAVFVVVTATEERLMQEAERCKHRLRLDGATLKRMAVALAARDPAYKPLLRLEPPYDADTLAECKLLQHSSKATHFAPMPPDELARIHRKHMPDGIAFGDSIFAHYSPKWEGRCRAVLGDARASLYHTYGDDRAILRTVDRIKLLWRILRAARADGGAHILIDAMLLNGQLVAAFPMHLPSVMSPRAVDELAVRAARANHPDRRPGLVASEDLLRLWTGHVHNKGANECQRFCCCYGRNLCTQFHCCTLLRPWDQPLAAVCDYFGEQVALYFAFVGHYLLWLAPAAVVGTLVFFVMMFAEDPSMWSSDWSGEIPAYVPIFGVLMSLWASLITEHWKRKNATLVARWGMTGFAERESSRPEFRPRALVPSPITGEIKSHFGGRGYRVCSTLMVVLVFVVACLASVTGTIFLKVFLEKSPGTLLQERYAQWTATACNAVIIQVFNLIYGYVAIWMTNFENHRTLTAYENHLIVKTFLFQFVNSYAVVFYVAFVKSRVLVGPVAGGDHQQYCLPRAANAADAADAANPEAIALEDPSDHLECIPTIGQSVLILFALMLFVNNFMELAWPIITDCCSKGKRKAARERAAAHAEELARLRGGLLPTADGRHSSRGIKRDSDVDEDVVVDQYGRQAYTSTFQEYSDLAIQYGYCIIFVVAFPLGPLLAFLSALVELRVDAYKLACAVQRPWPRNVEGIGAWLYIFEIIGVVAVLTNCALIFFLSEMIPASYGQSSRVAGFAAAVAAILVLKFLLAVSVPDTPRVIETMLQRNKHLVDMLLKQRKFDISVSDSSSSDNSDGGGGGRPMSSMGNGGRPAQHRQATTWDDEGDDEVEGTVEAVNRDVHNASQRDLMSAARLGAAV